MNRVLGGMGGRAKDLFAQNDITVVTGAPVSDPVSLVNAYLSETLVTGANTCDH
jgi:ATP-binding protein involved in chromosome partitioning